MKNIIRKHKIGEKLTLLTLIVVLGDLSTASRKVSCLPGVSSSFRFRGLFDFDAARIAEILKPIHEIYPDAFVDPPEYIRSRHYIPETHRVTTKDNYILTLHRIINPLVPIELRPLLKPVFLQHGLFTSSFNFIISSDKNRDRPRFNLQSLTRNQSLSVFTPEGSFSWQRLLGNLNDLTLARFGITDYSDHKLAPHLSDSLAFELSNQGYDVWMGNSRGSTFSLNHTLYDYRYDWRYWDFSFHEMGLYDLPSCIDYILAKRKRKSLAYIGHSQGSLSMFILQSLHPEWASKIKPFIALAPIAFLPDVYFGAMRILIKALSPLVRPKSLNKILKGQVLPNDGMVARALDPICVPKLTTPICDVALTLLLGNSLVRANQSLTPIVAHHIPEGTSALNLLHLGQMIESGEFRSFDFGPLENLRKYGSTINPYYPIGNIRSLDICFISGRKDPFATRKNLQLTKSMLRVPLMDEYIVPDPIWGHADYVYGMGAGRQVNAHIVEVCDRYRLVDL